MEKNLISVIMPVYNCEKYVEQAINSVINQTYKNWELIIINDASTDASYKIVTRFNNKNIKIINSEKNSGAAISRNIGITNANGEYIAFLDSDDIWECSKLEQQLDFMQKNNYVFSFTGFKYANEDCSLIKKEVQVPVSINYKQALKNTVILTSTVMLNVEKLGKKLIQMPNVGSEDTATWWKILKAENTAYGFNKALTTYRVRQGALSANKFVSSKRTWNLYRKVEKLSISKSLYNFINYSINAIKRRKK